MFLKLQIQPGIFWEFLFQNLSNRIPIVPKHSSFICFRIDYCLTRNKACENQFFNGVAK